MNDTMTDLANDDSLSRYLGYSIAIHFVIVLGFLVNTYFYSPLENLELMAAMRVDLVDLPDKIIDEPPASETPVKPEPVPVKSAETPKPPEVKTQPPPEEKAIVLDKKSKPEDTQKKQQDALSKLKQDSALEKIQKSLAEEKPQAQQQKVNYKGNQIMAGTELRGLAKAQHDQYVGSLEKVIRSNWALPEWLSKKNLKAQVRIKVNDRGEVVSIQLVKPSGNPSFDENVMATVQKSSPLPAPPERLALVLRNDGILLGFPE